LIVGTLHVLAVNSVQSLLNYYTEQLENTPNLSEIQNPSFSTIQGAKEEKDRKALEAKNKKAALKGPGMVQVKFILYYHNAGIVFCYLVDCLRFYTNKYILFTHHPHKTKNSFQSDLLFAYLALSSALNVSAYRSTAPSA
jgi:hypothetical protein